MPYYNYLGEEMPESAAPTSGSFGTAAGGETIVAPTGPSSIDGGGGGDILVAGQGDNFIYVKHREDVVRVADGLSGIKTIVAYSWYELPDNVHNLISQGARNFAVGNDLDNLIIISNDAQTLAGGAGNDVLVGGLGGNTFVVRSGEGNDVIYNFQGRDNVRLLDCNFMTFEQIKAAMTQVGSDVVLKINATETLTFRDMTVAAFTPQNFLMPLNPALLGAISFEDEFNAPDFYSHSTGEGTWRTDYGGPWQHVTSYTLPNNNEQQVYTTPDFQGTYHRPLGFDPFSFENGILTITAEPLGELATYAFGRPYSSGLLNTRQLFLQQYGYFEIRAETPNVPGTWPAFWMIPDPANGVEADIMESLGISPNVDFVRVYGPEGAIYLDAWRPEETGFHTYGMLWTAETVTMYLDGVAVLSVPTPASWHQPMYMIVNMAMGGWGGDIDQSGLPAEFNIDYVRAFELADGSSIVIHDTPDPLSATIRPHGAPITLQGAGDWSSAAMLTTGELALAALITHDWGGQTGVARVYDPITGAIIVPDFELYGYSMPGDFRPATITALDGGFWRIDYRGYEIHTNTGAPRYFFNEYTVGDPMFTPLVGGGQVMTDPTWDDVFLFADAQAQIDWLPEPFVNGVRTTPTQVEALTNGGFVFSYAANRQLDVYDNEGLHIATSLLGTQVADYAMAMEGLAGGDFAVAWLTPPATGGFDMQLTFQTFNAAGAALTAATYVAINRDPWHTEMRIMATDEPGQALLLWSEGGAIWGAFANGSTISASTVLMVGSLGDTTQTTLTDGNILFTWVEEVAGPDNIWAQILDPETLEWSRQWLGTGDGDIHVVATADGGFAVSWADGDLIEGRAYDGNTNYGPQAVVLGHFLGVDANGFLVSMYTDANGDPVLQHYEIMPDPFNYPREEA